MEDNIKLYVGEMGYQDGIIGLRWLEMACVITVIDVTVS